MRSKTETELINELRILTKDIGSKNKRIQEILLLLDLDSESDEVTVRNVNLDRLLVTDPTPTTTPDSTETILAPKNRVILKTPVRNSKDFVPIEKPRKELNIFMLFGVLGVVIAFVAIYVLGKAYIGVIPDVAKALFVYVLATIMLTLSFKLNKRGKELFYGLGQSFYLFAIMIGYVYYHLTTPLISFVLILIWLLAFNLLEIKYKPLFMNLLVTQVASLFLILYLSSESLLFAGIYSLVLIVFNKYRIKNIDSDNQKLLLHGASYFNLMLLIFRILVLF